MQYKQVDDDFIGYRYGCGSQLGVVGWDGSRNGRGIKLYTVHCDVCETDPELHGDATYKMAKGDILVGGHPCGCSLIPKWTTAQYKVKVTRAAAEKNLIVHGFSTDVIQSDTKIRLECNVCGHKWSTCNVSHFTGTESNGCPSCKKKAVSLAQTKTDEEMTAGFMASGKFLEGTKFWRSDKLSSTGYKPYWNYSCPSCSNDEYVKAGVCSGVFTASSNHLRQGKQTCRCGGRAYWSKQQREYQINKKLERFPKHTFVGWATEYTNNTSKITLHCEEHGNWDTTISNFLGIESRSCPDCAKSGYNRQRDGYVYIVLAESMYSSFTGYGITNNPVTRLTKHSYNFKAAGFTPVLQQVYKMGGHAAPAVEKAIKLKFPVNSQAIEGFITEATHAYLYEDVVSFVKEQLALTQETA